MGAPRVSERDRRARRRQLGHRARDSLRARRPRRAPVGPRPALMDEIARRARERRATSRSIRVGDSVTPTASLEAALGGAPIVIAAVPSHGMRHVLQRAAPLARARRRSLVSATKGLETDSLDRMSQVMAEESAAAIRSPCSRGRASRSRSRAACRPPSSSRPPIRDRRPRVQDSLKGPTLRLYGSDDVTGVEFGGALKNVIAIAAGVVEGLGIGHNAMAALITRGLVEMSRLACAEGSRRDTLAGPERPRRPGPDLHRRPEPEPARRDRARPRPRAAPTSSRETQMVAEGVRTTGAALALGARHGVELPLAAQMAAVLEGRTTARERRRGPDAASRSDRKPITPDPWVSSTRSSSPSPAPRNSSSSGSTRSSAAPTSRSSAAARSTSRRWRRSKRR